MADRPDAAGTPPPAADGTPGPLHGIRVIDLTRVLSGPFATMVLGDLGADVVKVETPSGDPVRGQGTLRNGLSWYFASFNRNKRSVVLDLYTEEGRESLRGLLADADVVVDNFRPGTMARMGFGPEELAAINPRLVAASVNGWGSTGPYVDRPAFDFVIQAMSGFMSTNGPDGTPPMRAAAPVTDLVAGLYCVIGVLAALRERDGSAGREGSGLGQKVEVAMLNSMLSLMAYLASEYFATGVLPARTGNDHPLVAPYGLYRTSDGEIAVAPSNDTILGRFLKTIDLGWVLSDERFQTNADRFARRPELTRLIEARLASGTEAEWIEKLNAAGVPCGRVQDFDAVFRDPQVIAQEMKIEVPHGDAGPVSMLGFPIKLSRTPCRVHHPTPALGEHTEDVTRETEAGSRGRRA